MLYFMRLKKKKTLFIASVTQYLFNITVLFWVSFFQFYKLLEIITDIGLRILNAAFH